MSQRKRLRRRLAETSMLRPTPSLRATPPEGICTGCEEKGNRKRPSLASLPEVNPLWRGARQGGVGRQRWLITALLSATLWPLLTTTASAQFARLYSVENGDVYLRRPNWSDFYRTQPRTQLTGDDVLIVEGDASTRVTLLCPNGTQSLWTTGVGQAANVGSTCFGTPRWFRPSFGISDTWHAEDATKPYVISPWSGQVLTTTPHFRWNSVESAQEYSVTLLRRDGESWEELWTVSTTRASICYPRDEAELELGKAYALRVTVVGEDVPVEDPSVVFSAISGPPRRAAEGAITAINALPIDRATKVVRLVEEVYPDSELYAEGINDLTALINDGIETAQIQRLLGDYYLRSGLVIPAEESYLAALALAEVEENIEEEAIAAWGIGTIYGRVGDTENALIYLEQAQELATTIGDSELIAGISSELSRLMLDNEV